MREQFNGLVAAAAVLLMSSCGSSTPPSAAADRAPVPVAEQPLPEATQQVAVPSLIGGGEWENVGSSYSDLARASTLVVVAEPTGSPETIKVEGFELTSTEFEITSQLKGSEEVRRAMVDVVTGFTADVAGRESSPFAQDAAYLLYLEPFSPGGEVPVRAEFVPTGGPAGILIDLDGSGEVLFRMLVESALPDSVALTEALDQ